MAVSAGAVRAQGATTAVQRRLYDPASSTPLSRKTLRRAGLRRIERQLGRKGYAGRIYIFDTNRFTEDDLREFAEDLTEGTLLRYPVILNPMRPQECHQNVKELIHNNPQFQEWTGLGYDANEEGWVNHSWVVDDTKGTIIETTVRFDAYFGYRTLYDQVRVARMNDAGSPRPAVIANADNAILIEGGDALWP